MDGREKVLKGALILVVVVALCVVFDGVVQWFGPAVAAPAFACLFIIQVVCWLDSNLTVRWR